MNIETESSHTHSDLPRGFDTYKQYVALKSHFTGSYNWKRYEGKVAITEASFDKRRDKKFFQILESRFTPVERNQIFLANFVLDKHLWVGEFLTETSISTWAEWKGRISKMYYLFEEDLKKSLDEVQRRKKLSSKEALKFLISKPEDTHPLILRFLWGGMFGVESYLLLSQILKLRQCYEPYVREDRAWSDFEFRLEKYSHFLKSKIDIDNATHILKKVIKEL